MERLAAAWHARVLADEVVSHAFSHGYHHEHTTRLAAYWAEALGAAGRGPGRPGGRAAESGPAAYSGTLGDETAVVRMHRVVVAQAK